MARYIECETACAEVDKGDLLVGNNAEFAKEIINRTPTADVISQDFLTRKEDEAYNRGYAEAKIEVAREIFEEIERETKNHGITYAQRKIAELKKKYTEEMKNEQM